MSLPSWRGAATLAILSSFCTIVRAEPILFTISPYNVYVSGNFADTSDVGGGLAVGGTDTATASPIAGDLLGLPVSDFPLSTTLAATTFNGTTTLGGGNFWVGNTGVEMYGNQYWPSANSSYAIYTSSNLSPLPNSPINFTAQSAQFRGISQSYSQMAATAGDGCAYDGSYWTNCTVSAAGLNVINLASDALLSHGIDIQGVSAASPVVINVAGAADSLNPNVTAFEIDGIAATSGDGAGGLSRYVLFNFYQATGLTIGAVGGSILAPNATVSGKGSQMDGQLIAASYNLSSGATEFHNELFAGPAPGAVPEPSTIVPIGAGLALALCCAHRKKTR